MQSDDTIETYHDRVRETVVGLIEDEKRKRHHKDLANALLQCESKDTESLARHFLGAGESSRAVSHLLDAADGASKKLAFERAVGLYRMILKIASEFEPVMIRTKLGHALSLAGRSADAASVYFEAAKLAPNSVALNLTQKAAGQLLRAGYYDQGHAALRGVARELGFYFPKSKWSAIASLLLQRCWVFLRGYGFTPKDVDSIEPRSLMQIDTYWSLMSGLGMVDPIAGLDFQTRAMLKVLRAGEVSRVARVLFWESVYVGSRGVRALGRARKRLELAIEVSTRGNCVDVAGMPQFAEGIVAFFSGQWKRSFELLQEGRVAFLQHPANEWEYTNSCHYAIWSLAYLGEFAEMRKRVKSRLRESLERGDIYSATSIAVGNSNLAWVADDDPGTARREANVAISRWSHQSYQIPHFFYDYAIIQLDLYCDNARSAHESMARTWKKLKASFFLLLVQHVRTEALQLRARCAVALAAKERDRRSHLHREAESLAKQLLKESAPYSMPYAALIRAAIAWQNADRNETIRQLEQAIIGFVASDMNGYANAAKRRLGVLLDSQKGVELRAHADEWMHKQAIVNPIRWTQMLAPGFD